MRKIKPNIRPKVDIVTTLHGGLNFLQGLAESLYAHDAGATFQWIVVDDATPEEKGRKELIAFARGLEQTHNNVLFIENRVNGGYAKANNLGVSKGRAEYVLLLNSDTMIMHDNWLAIMLKNFETIPGVGIVGAKLLYFPDSNSNMRPAGMIQHAGVVFNLLGEPYHIFMGWHPDHPKVNRRQIMQAVTGACFLIKRSVWNIIGVLNEVYTMGNFEDVEACVRARMNGYVCVYEPEAVLYHYGGGSENNKTIAQNYQIFKLRNNNYIMYDDWRYW